jgi:hypothetical protein
MEVREIMNCDNLQKLCEEKQALTDRIGGMHISLRLCEEDMERTEIKSGLTSANSLLEIVNQRIEDVRTDAQLEQREQDRINYNFRTAAKSLLTKETYAKVMDEAVKTRREFKEQKRQGKLPI